MNTVRVLFAGDFAPCRKFERLVLAKKEDVFNDALELIKAADISFVNLECPLTTSQIAIKKSGPALKASPDAAKAIKSFSVAGLANNHIFDYGEEGLKDTLKACKNVGVKTVGAGLSLEEAQQIYVHESKGVKVAIIAIAEHEFNQSEDGGAGSAPIDLVDNFKQIEVAKKLADIIVVTIHGGNEYFPYPRPKLRKLCKHFIDLGVDAVVCHHPHVPGAYEAYSGKPIYYSIGNLLFDNSDPQDYWEQGYFVELTFDVEKKEFLGSEIHPYIQSASQGGVRLLAGADKRAFISRIELYKELLGSEDDYRKVWSDFIEENTNGYIMRAYNPLRFRGLGFLTRKFPYLIGFLFGKGKRDLDRLNLIRCQSHLEVLSDALKKRLGGYYK